MSKSVSLARITCWAQGHLASASLCVSTFLELGDLTH